MMSTQLMAAGTKIEIGHHVTVNFLGMTFNADTIWSTVVAGLVVIGLGLWMRSKVTSGVPSKVQLMWEGLVNVVTVQVEGSLGRVNPFVVPLAIALFTFILIANWVELVPTMEVFPSPTADVNLTFALAFFVIVGVHAYGIHELGLKGAYAHLVQPYKVLFPILLIEEIVKPFTLALRLFGNIFSGGIMVSIIGLLPTYVLWGPNGLWKLFDMFIGVIQAFIFALLTILYFGMAGEKHDDADHEEHAAPEQDHSGTREPVPEGAR